MPWEIFDKFYNAHWFLTGYSCRNFSELLQEGGCVSLAEFIGIMENDVNTMIFDTGQFDQAANYYANKLINNNVWREKMYKRFYFYAKKYFEAGERLLKVDVAKLSDRQLVEKINKIIPLQEQVRILGVTLNGLVLDGRNHLTNKFQDEITRSVKDKTIFEEHWPFLTRVTKLSFRQKRDIAIAKLAEKIKKYPETDKEKELKNIYQAYCWLDYMYYGPPTNFNEYKKYLKNARKKNIYLNLKYDLEKIKNQQEKLMKKLKFNSRTKFLIELAQNVLWQKGYRKDAEYHGFFCYEPILREIAKRKQVDDWKSLLFMFPWEIEGFILKNKPNKKEISERRKFSCLVVTKNDVKMLTGRKAKSFYKALNIENDFSHLTQTQGQCAYVGKAKGFVKLIFTPKDIEKMNKGDVIISQATSPDLIPAMKQAAAIVTNTGGLICHAAITSRELKIPCIVGTKNATLIFKDGDLVEVDAQKGMIKKIKK